MESNEFMILTDETPVTDEIASNSFRQPNKKIEASTIQESCILPDEYITLPDYLMK